MNHKLAASLVLAGVALFATAASAGPRYGSRYSGHYRGSAYRTGYSHRGPVYGRGSYRSSPNWRVRVTVDRHGPYYRPDSGPWATSGRGGYLYLYSPGSGRSSGVLFPPTRGSRGPRR
jgi:hypothetical protein